MQYFKHMSNMRHDLKLKRIIKKFGLRGYGLYNLILESITEHLNDNSPYPVLEETAEDIAEFYNEDLNIINEMISYITQQKLLESEKSKNVTNVSDNYDRILCKKIYKFLEASSTRSMKIRTLIKKYKEFSKQLEIEVSQMSQTVTDKSDRIRKEKEKEKEKTINSEKLKNEIKIIIDYLNLKCKKYNKKFTYKNKSFNSHINARLSDNFTIDDFKKVIDNKLKDKNFQDNPGWYNPDTLFTPGHFEKYLNESPKKTESEIQEEQEAEDQRLEANLIAVLEKEKKKKNNSIF